MRSNSLNCNRQAILGIDAAWGSRNSSGVALIARECAGWKCLRVAPSYSAFVSNTLPPKGERLDASKLLSTCSELLAGQQPDVIAVDMPIGNQAIVGRRSADREVSRRFGHVGCAVHSPTVSSPGEVSRAFVEQFGKSRYRCDFGNGTSKLPLIEVYPHVALLVLCKSTFRLPYKAQKTSAYWPDTPIKSRYQRLVAQWQEMLACLRTVISGIDLELPDADVRRPFVSLKGIEDQIDALVCAWVGGLYLDGQATALGDDQSAIWMPKNKLTYGSRRSRSGPEGKRAMMAC